MPRALRTLPALLLLTAAPLAAQNAPAQRSAADGVYTQAQADRGETAFRATCASCHVLSDFTGPNFLKRWSNVGSLFETISTTMPQDFPGGLTAQQYADVVAYFLRRNSFPTGPDELPKEKAPLSAIVIPQPGG